MSGNSIVADTNPPSRVQQVHPGGFFWNVQRADRLAHVVSFVSQTRRLAVVANSDREVEEYSERLRLSGVPVHQAMGRADSTAIDGFLSDAASTLIASNDYFTHNGPVAAAMVVHLRAARSVREYVKRLDALPSAVHLTLVVPEDERRAQSLQSHFEHDQGHGGALQVDVSDLIDLTVSEQVASVTSQRRRFPLGRQ